VVGWSVSLLFYVPVNIYNSHFVIFNKVFAVVLCISGQFVISSLICILLDFWSRLGVGDEGNRTGQDHEDNGVDQDNSFDLHYVFKLVFDLTGIIAFIAFTEETIKVNHLDLSGRHLPPQANSFLSLSGSSL